MTKPTKIIYNPAEFYYQPKDYMITKLGLKGAELRVFAVLAELSEGTSIELSMRFLADTCMVTYDRMKYLLKKLEDKGYVSLGKIKDGRRVFQVLV